MKHPSRISTCRNNNNNNNTGMFSTAISLYGHIMLWGMERDSFVLYLPFFTDHHKAFRIGLYFPTQARHNLWQRGLAFDVTDVMRDHRSHGARTFNVDNLVQAPLSFFDTAKSPRRVGTVLCTSKPIPSFIFRFLENGGEIQGRRRA
jgi:hypothetical protein